MTKDPQGERLYECARQILNQARAGNLNRESLSDLQWALEDYLEEKSRVPKPKATREEIKAKYPSVRTLEQVKREHIIEVLKLTRGHREHAAMLLGISLRGLRLICKKLRGD